MMETTKAKLLYVEDEIDLGNVTKQYLELMDLHVDWTTAAQPALQSFLTASPGYNIIIIDIQLPDMDGFDLAEKMLEINPAVYLVFLTARKEKNDRLRGLKMGAVNYITKPFDVDELVLLLQNMLKHQVSNNEIPAPSIQESLAIGDLHLEKSRLLLTLPDGQIITLTKRETDLLEYFYLNQGKVLKRETILKDLWGDNDYFLGRSLDVFISRLRKLFRQSSNVRIENVYGVGFLLKID
ncbi:DNA-binding response regulator, OmpR family, contains REC and winged-helix (wHTH) domain [bacterium A37T11]|nr:DNA-binding response regulator, OmpR family, contains REC and winged-helix (wHTH) domain [bacterium A37T11]